MKKIVWVLVICAISVLALIISYVLFFPASVNTKEKISVFRVGTDSLSNRLVNSFDGDIVYYSDNGIYLNDRYVQGFEDKIFIYGIALDSKNIYYCFQFNGNDEFYYLMSINRETGKEEELLSSSYIELIQFKDEIVVCYENGKNIAFLLNGKISENKDLYDEMISLGGEGRDVLCCDKNDYKFVYKYSDYSETYFLCYVEKGEERRNTILGGVCVVATENGYYTTDDTTDPKMTIIDLINGGGTDQSLLSWNDKELYIISREAGGPGAYNYSYDMKRGESLGKYDFDSGTMTELITMKPSEGQIIGMSLEKQKIYVLSGKKVYEMSFTGENKKEIGEIPVVDRDRIYVEMCENKLYIFSEPTGESFKLIQTIGI